MITVDAARQSLVVRRGELTDKAWQRIEPLLPETDGRGRPWCDHREVINGILSRLRSGSPGRTFRTFQGGPKTGRTRRRHGNAVASRWRSRRPASAKTPNAPGAHPPPSAVPMSINPDTYVGGRSALYSCLRFEENIDRNSFATSSGSL
ncbi:transposase [Microbispora sp. H10949]|uniref:transposase n=1 Tax=Microbispora sp. H10949 TaxID=2729111 RepID=UPI001C728287